MHDLLWMGGNVGDAGLAFLLAVTMFLANMLGSGRRERQLRAVIRRPERRRRVNRE